MSTRRALLIGIDGFNLPRIDAVQAPTLRQLRAEAYYAPSRIYDDGTSTVSGPGWSTILTGAWPGKHGVVDNNIVPNNLATYPDLITRAAENGKRTFYAATWEPLYQQILTSNVTHRWVTPKSTPERDAEVAKEAARLLAEEDFDLGFVYFGSTDEEAHAFGAESPAYDAAIAAVDGHVAELLSAIGARPAYDDEEWLVLIATDHGHRPEGGHGGQSDAERSTFVIGTGDGLSAERFATAKIVDIAPTLLAHTGVSVDPQWELDGRSLLEEKTA